MGNEWVTGTKFVKIKQRARLRCGNRQKGSMLEEPRKECEAAENSESDNGGRLRDKCARWCAYKKKLLSWNTLTRITLALRPLLQALALRIARVEQYSEQRQCRSTMGHSTECMLGNRCFLSAHITHCHPLLATKFILFCSSVYSTIEVRLQMSPKPSESSGAAQSL